MFFSFGIFEKFNVLLMFRKIDNSNILYAFNWVIKIVTDF
jgi:hypothetical protein